MNNNNIDKLFQEKLKSLEVTPNGSVWNNIESKLKKKKKKVLPIWWFTTGVAALLVFGLFLFPFSDNENTFDKKDTNIIITESDAKKTTPIYKAKIDSSGFQNKILEEKIIITEKKTTIKPIKNKRKLIDKPNNEKELVSKENAMKKIFLADNSVKKIVDIIKDEKIVVDKNKVNTHHNKENNKHKKNAETKEKSTRKKIDFKKYTEKKDSVFKIKKSKNKWTIAPVFAVLSSNSFTNTSPINNNLSNSTKGKSSLSYGFQIGYKINKKWSIQSGVHLQETNFTNNQVNAVASISANSSAISFNNGIPLSFNNSRQQASDLASTTFSKRSSLIGDLNQKYGYIEIPIEVKYNFLSTKKFNTQIVAGFSSLFLNKNEIDLSTQFSSKSGIANNLNNINFSGNLGFDFNYNLNKNWSLNLNPMVKAQLNTFSENANGFSPFNVGLYSGIKYTF